MPELRLDNSVVDDRYLVERCLGRGSYAEIFLAYDQHREDRLVIIKSLNTSLQGTPDPELEQTLVENFQNEAIALDRVRHPHIIQRLGHGTAADLEGVPFHYLVLEYMPGGDLWSLCRKRPVGLDDALFYFQQVAEALAYAHSQRVIHRDIKPNNLLLSADHRELKIADFGVAKMTHDDASEITRVGTNVYAPPEHHPDVRADDLNEKLTPSADVYSLAKTIYTAMTGRAPRQFSREPINALSAELAAEPWAGALLSVLRKATESRAAERYQSVEEFWSDFALVKLEHTGDNPAVEDPEATIVRARLRTTGEVEQAAAKPNFQTLAVQQAYNDRPQKARIVVEFPSRSEPGITASSLAKFAEATEDLQRRIREETEGETAKARRRRIAELRAKLGTRETDQITAPTPGYPPTYAPGAGAEAAQVQVAVTPAIGEAKPSALRARKIDDDSRPPSRRPSFKAFVTSEWLRRVFTIFLAAALIGLAASTYYHFADRRTGLPFFGSPAKDGRIAGALNVNLRTDASGSSSVLAALPAGTRVRVFEERGAWVRIKILDWAGAPPDNAPDSGWVDGRFVKLD